MSVRSHNRVPAPISPGAASDGVSLAGILGALWRQKLAIVLPTLLAGAVTAAWLLNVNPTYLSTAKILIESQESSPPARIALDEEAVRSQQQLVLSADLGRDVVRKLGLVSHAEFAAKEQQSALAGLLSLVGITRDANRRNPEEKVLDQYYERLSVRQIDNSRVISIGFSAEDPDLAARVANAVAEGYVELQRTARREASFETSNWLGAQIAQLRREVEEAERRVANFRREHSLFVNQRSDASQTLSQQQIVELTSQLAGVRTQKSDVQARARLIGEMLASGAPLEAMDVLNSQLIQNLDQEQVRLRAQLAEVSTTLGPLHPRIKELNAEVADLRRQIIAEAERIVRALENDARVAAEREAQLLAGIETLKAEAGDANEWEAQLRSLERDARSQRELLESMLARYAQADARGALGGTSADARIISRATPASEPNFPSLWAILPAIMLGVGIIGAGAAIGREVLSRDKGLTAMVGVPDDVPAIAPDLVAHVAMEQPRSVGRPGARPAATRGAAALTAIGDAILNKRQGEAGTLVLVTSIRRNEALADTALRLARYMSSTGQRVVLVDTAFGDEITASISGSTGRGLGELLSGKAAFEATLFRDPASRVHVIPAGEGSPDPWLLLASQRMDTVLEALTQTYDVVILLAPSINRRAEARILASRAVFGVLVTRTDGSDASSQRARMRLHEAGIRDVAIAAVEDNAVAEPRAARTERRHEAFEEDMERLPIAV